MRSSLRASDFFVAGGTLRRNSPCYVKRPADDELFKLASAGTFCYVLTARQMGKSSLMIRTALRLNKEGVRTAIIDLTGIGTISVTVDEWLLNLLSELADALRLRIDLETWWQEHASLGPVKRFINFLRDVVLAEIEKQIVIFIDEIDSTFNLDFSDDFFTAIRFINNAQATDPIYQRLTFVLLGVATPSDLIKDRTRTPFNVGQAIDLKEFSRHDAQVLQQGLAEVYPGREEATLDRIFYWTNGHPYLTQKLCLAAAEDKNGAGTEQKIDRLVESLFLSQEARREINLQFVRDNITSSPQRYRLLELYRKVYKGKKVQENERSSDQNQLKLFGLVQADQGYLKVRNRIYRRVFNPGWIKENMPVNWARRTAAISVGLLILVVAYTSFIIYSAGNAEVEAQAKVFEDSFRVTSSSDVRINSLAGLFELPGYEDRAKYLFYQELTTEGRLNLFKAAAPQAVGVQLITVIKNLYSNLHNNEHDNFLLKVMGESIQSLDDPGAVNLAVEIEQWLQGREFYNSREFEQAAGVYSAVISLNDQNPGTYFDRGLAYAASDKPAHALADFETVLGLDEQRREQIEDVVLSSVLLYDTVIAEENVYPAVVALVPSPTSTPTPTFTPVPLTTSPATSEPATAPPPTETPAPEKPPAEMAIELTTVMPAVEPVEESTPLPTPTPSPTPTATPQPVTVVYVESSEQVHNLGILTADEVIKLEQASAPAWSPDGTKIAFFGEAPLYNAGIWVVDSQGQNPMQLFPNVGTETLSAGVKDHIKNLTWAPDGTMLAFETDTPSEFPEIWVIDSVAGRPISRFSGEQPAWGPNSKELIIRSCTPRCGLWQVGLDGSGGRQLTFNSSDSYPAWSPTGEYLVFSRFFDNNWEIYRIQMDNRRMMRLTNRPSTDTTPVFSPDGLEVYLRTDPFGIWRVSAISIDGRNERVIRDNIGPSDIWGLARPTVY